MAANVSGMCGGVSHRRPITTTNKTASAPLRPSYFYLVDERSARIEEVDEVCTKDDDADRFHQ